MADIIEQLLGAMNRHDGGALMRWQGAYRDGSPFLMGGAMVFGVREDTIAWARLYMEPVEQGGADIDGAVQELYRSPPDADGAAS